MGSGLKSKGVTIGIGNGATPESFTDIATILDTNVPELSQGALETGGLGDEWETKISDGLKKAGDVTIEFLTYPGATGLDALEAAFDDCALHNFQVTLTDTSATKWTFAALVSKLSPGKVSKGQLIKGTAVLTVSGEPVKG